MSKLGDKISQSIWETRGGRPQADSLKNVYDEEDEEEKKKKPDWFAKIKSMLGYTG